MTDLDKLQSDANGAPGRFPAGAALGAQGMRRRAFVAEGEL